MGELGYGDQDIAIFPRYHEGRTERVEGFVKELRAEGVRVFVSLGSAIFAKPFLNGTPLVLAVAFDPVEAGTVESLARPGGDITGVATLTPSQITKRIELLKEIAPRVSRIALFRNKTTPEGLGALQLRTAEDAGRALGLEVSLMEFDQRKPDAIEEVFSSAASKGIQGFVMATIVAQIVADRAKVVDVVGRYGLLGIYPTRELVEAGGLAYLGDDNVDLIRRSASYVDRILKGAKPADLPISIQEKLELGVNLRAAQQFGLTPLPSLLERATLVIR
jgi:putative ABC transport system substrate-binding protein